MPKPVHHLLAAAALVGAGAPALAAPAGAVAGVHQISIADASVGEGASGSKGSGLVVSLDRADPLAPITVKARVCLTGTSCTATTPEDYDPGFATRTITFQPGETSKLVPIDVQGDGLAEPNETVVVLLSEATNASIADGEGTLTIVNDDGDVPKLDLGPNVTVAEGTGSGTTTATFTAVLTAPATPGTVTVDYEVVPGTAGAGDLTGATTGTLTFSGGVRSLPIPVQVARDASDEPDEVFTVRLKGARNAVVQRGEAVGTITDDDEPPTITVADVAKVEGDSGTSSLAFEVVLSAASGKPVTVAYATQDGTATAGTDYAATSGTISFGTAKSVVVNVPVNGDGTKEPEESFTFVLSSPSGATIADGTATGTIKDDDATPTLAIDSVSAEEGTAGTPTTFRFTVTLSGATDVPASVDVGTADGTAKAPGDLTATSGTLTFPAGTTSRTIDVPVVADGTDEPDEAFTVKLANPVGATIAAGTGTGTIRDDDAPPTISIADASGPEGGTVAFAVSLSAPSLQEVAVTYETAAGSAAAGVDYTSAGGQVKIPAGSTSATIDVTALQDALDEPAEGFSVSLSAPVNATIADGTAVGVIVDDDPGVELTVDDVTVAEGAAGSTSATFVVRRSTTSGQAVSVAYATRSGTATAAEDFTATTGTVTFPAGSPDLSATVAVPVAGDVVREADETFSLDLSSPSGGTIADAEGLATITNDDGPPPTLGVASTSAAEGAAGATPTVTITFTLSSPQPRDVVADWATVAGSAGAADFTAAPAGSTVTIPAGSTSATRTVQLKGDAIDEPDETFTVTVSNVRNAADGADGTVTITDDDATPNLSVGDVTVAEGASGTSPATFPVTLSAPSGRTVTVAYATADGTATSGSDLTATSGTLTFQPGETTKSIAVPVIGDVVDEADAETFSTTLSSPAGATLAKATGTGTITDDDAAPALSVSDASGVEPGSLGFTVSLDAASGRTVTVRAATAAGGTASAGQDFAPTSVDLTFAPGQRSATVTVPVLDDAADEPDETVVLALSAPTAATIGDGTGTGTIVDDDVVVGIAIDDVVVPEGDAASTASVPVRLSAPSSNPVTVAWETVDVSAEAPGDYLAGSGTLTFQPGDVEELVPVSIVGDRSTERFEVLGVLLSSPSGGSFAEDDDDVGLVGIADDDASPELVAASGPGPVAAVATYDAAGSRIGSFQPYGGYRGGAFVARGDLDGDAVDELITGAGPGGGPHVIVWERAADGSMRAVSSFFAFPDTFKGGVRVAAADVDGDGVDELLTAAGAGGGPTVGIWRIGEGGQATQLASFFAYPTGFVGGVYIAGGDVDGDGREEIVTGPGAGGGPNVRVWQIGAGGIQTATSFFAYDTRFVGGVQVATADWDGDGTAELVTGAGPGGGPHVRVVEAGGQDVAGFFPYPSGFVGGVFVAALDLDGDGADEVVTGPGVGGGPHVRVFAADGPRGGGFIAELPEGGGGAGVRVAAGLA